MYSLKTLLHLALLPLVANAYILRAYTDSECTEGEKDMSADDPSSNGSVFFFRPQLYPQLTRNFLSSPCMDIGFTAKSIYWVDDYPLGMCKKAFTLAFFN